MQTSVLSLLALTGPNSNGPSWRRSRILELCAIACVSAGLALPSHAQDAGEEWLSFGDSNEAAANAPGAGAMAMPGGEAAAGTASFQGTGRNPWDEYDKQVQGSGVVGTLGPDLFGDTVEFYKNTLSFSLTDISLPGNFPLPVALTRKLTVSDRYAYDGSHDGPLQDWDLDIPNISGVYASTWANDRCSFTQLPTAPPFSDYDTDDFWNGLNANMPGGGELLRPIIHDPLKPEKKPSPRPANGVSYPWMTAGFTYIRCLPAVGNTTGEGFEALTSDGTRYTFGWMAQNFQPDLRRPKKTTSQGDTFGYAPLVRRLNAMYVTRIEDRFGNSVTYTYDNAANAPVRLRSIQASDGRLITLDYTGATLASATAHGRTWTYQYTGGSLSSVILPDASRWTYDFAALSGAVIDPDPDPATPRSCNSNAYWIGGGGTGTVTHPSGAVGTFTVAPMRHGRSNVPKFCQNWEYTANNPNDDIAVLPKAYDVLSISRKQVSGPGLVPFEWEFSGGSLASWAAGANAPGYVPVCQTTTCLEPVCVDDGCAGKHISSVVGREVVSPTEKIDRDFQRITFGNSYKYNEGKLLRIERGATASSVLEVEAYGYNLARTGQAFATPIGTSLQTRAAGFASEYLRPQASKVITRDGVDFAATVATFDKFARPTVTDRSSLVAVTGPAIRTKRETTTYHDQETPWVLGQVEKTSVDGIEVSRTEFDARQRPSKIYSFGLLQQTLGYDDTAGVGGTLRTVADGKGNTTTLSSWYRGIPRAMTLADSNTVSAAVNDAGWITQVTDELGTTTAYDYDAMGRLKLIDYTNLDPVPWTSTNRTFAPIAVAEYGVPAGSWKQVVWTGNGRTSTWYNARWQPVLVLTEDTANTATRSFVVTRHDANGRAVFQSYPVATMTNIASTLPGIATEYDGLGRVTHVRQDSELSPNPVLDTQTEYLAGFQTRVTNPRGFATTTQYQAYDSPSTDAPIRITAPETQTTVIDRDRFGKPLSITRSGSYAGSAVSATRSYVYDANQRLCKTVEPESGATVLNYDAAGNIDWSATGQTLTALVCDRNLVGESAKTRRTYDAIDRIRLIDVPGSANDPTYDYFADGALKSLVNGGARWDYTYNRRRLPDTETLTVGGKVRTLTHGYNPNGHELRLTYPSGLIVNHVPNARGQATQASSFATGVAYFPNGGMKEFTYGACSGSPAVCVKHAMTQNVRQLPLRTLDQRGTGTPILFNNYTYDANGNVAGITDGGGNPGRTRDQLAYDGLDRLTHTRAPSLAWINADTAYDPLDNIRSNTVGSRTWTYLYDATRNRLATLLKPAATTVDYDDNGNIKAHGAAGYTFDAANRLVEAIGKESYDYDGHGRRVRMTRTSDGLASFPMYSLDGKLITEDDNRSNQTTDYVYLNGSLVAKQYRTIGGTTWTKRFLYTDALGSPVAETDAAGTLTRTEHYTPHGEQTDTIAGGTIEQGPAFTGHVTDAATGLSYMQQRYYDPMVGRFLSNDPASADPRTGARFNRYAYAANNPLRFADPTGATEVEVLVQRTSETDRSTSSQVTVSNGTSSVRVFGLEPPSAQRNAGGANAPSRMAAGEHSAFVRDGATSTHGRDVIEIAGNVRGTDGRDHSLIQVHIGNTPADTEGCLLVGETQSQDYVGSSTAAFNSVMGLVNDTVQADQQSGQQTTITIKYVDPPPPPPPAPEPNQPGH